MLHTMKRALFVGSAVVVVAALCSGSALAARGHAKFGPRAAKGMPGGFGQFAGMGGFGGPAFGMKGHGFGEGFGPGFGPGFGFGGHGMRGHGPGGPGMRGPGGGGILATGVLKTSATYLGLSLSALQAELKGGKTLAKVADGTSGKTAAGLIAALTAEAKDNLDAAVAADWLTQKQADAMLEHATEEITMLVNNGPPVPPEKRPGPLDAAAKYLGVTVADLRTALKDGKSLADVAARRYPLQVSVKEDPTHSTRVMTDQVLAYYGFALADIETWGGRLHMSGSPSDPRRMEPMKTGVLEAVFDEALAIWFDDALACGLAPIELEDAAFEHLAGLGWRRVTIKAGDYKNLKRDHACIDYSGWPLYASASLPDRLAYEVCGAFAAREAEIPWEESYEGPAQLGRDTAATPNDVPLHPGAARWYAENAR